MGNFVRLSAGLVSIGLMSAACSGTAVPPPATGTQRQCALPAPGKDFEAVNPADVGMDPAAVASAVSLISKQNSWSVRVFRHGCLVGQTTDDAKGGYQNKSEFFSMAKSVVALGVGRAVTLNLMSLDDTVSKYFPKADAAHGKITVRQLLNDTAGLYFDWVPDVLGSVINGLDFFLGLPKVAEPGDRWAYSQTSFTMLAAMVTKAVGIDFQTFMQYELYSPIGISRSDWEWARDAAGNTHGYAFLQGNNVFAARLGHLVMNDGVWDGQRLLSEAFMAELRTGTPVQPAYGLGVRLNQGDWHTDAATGGHVARAWNPGAPRDLIEFSGAMSQKVSIIPSLDLVYVRFGFQGSNSGWDQDVYPVLLKGIQASN